MQMFQTKDFELYCPKSMQAVLIRPGTCQHSNRKHFTAKLAELYITYRRVQRLPSGSPT